MGGVEQRMDELQRALGRRAAALDGLADSPIPGLVGPILQRHHRRRQWLAALIAVQVPTLALASALLTVGPARTTDDMLAAGEAALPATEAAPDPVPVAAGEPPAPKPTPTPVAVSEPPAPAPAPAPPCASGRSCNPLAVASLPHAASGDTRDALDNAVDVWPCATDIPEAGPEVWYAITVTDAGTLTATIAENRKDGIDVDVHLLSAPAPSACVARGNASAAATVTPGTWYVVIDSCSIDGIVKAGPYRLTIALEP